MTIDLTLANRRANLLALNSELNVVGVNSSIREIAYNSRLNLVLQDSAAFLHINDSSAEIYVNGVLIGVVNGRQAADGDAEVPQPLPVSDALIVQPQNQRAPRRRRAAPAPRANVAPQPQAAAPQAPIVPAVPVESSFKKAIQWSLKIIPTVTKTAVLSGTAIKLGMMTFTFQQTAGTIPTLYLLGTVGFTGLNLVSKKTRERSLKTFQCTQKILWTIGTVSSFLLKNLGAGLQYYGRASQKAGEIAQKYPTLSGMTITGAIGAYLGILPVNTIIAGIIPIITGLFNPANPTPTLQENLYQLVVYTPPV